MTQTNESQLPNTTESIVNFYDDRDADLATAHICHRLQHRYIQTPVLNGLKGF